MGAVPAGRFLRKNRASLLESPRTGGFTLLELLIVLVLMAILAGGVLPMMGSSAPAKLRGAARLIIADIQYVQQRAMGTGLPLSLEFLGGNRYRAVDPLGGDINNPKILDYPGGEYPVHKNRFIVDFDDPGPLRDVTLESAQFAGQTSLRFGPFGEPDAGGEIVLQCYGYRVRLTVAPVTGRVSVGELEKA